MRETSNVSGVCGNKLLLALVLAAGAIASLGQPFWTNVRAQASRPATSVEDAARICKDDRDRVQNGLKRIFFHYQRSPSPKSIETLVDLDSSIRALLEGRPSYRPCPDDVAIYDERWAALCVQLGHCNDIIYSGLLLYQAHRRAPHSHLRSSTLFSTVFGTKPYHGLGIMPDINAAFGYAREFPEGPFSKETYLVIADFYKDLFMVLRDGERGYKYDCFKPYIRAGALESQKQRAKRLSLKYYRKVLEREPANEQAATWFKEVGNETVKAWSFCAD